MTEYLSDGSRAGALPSKSFGPSSGDQAGGGVLTHDFTLPLYDQRTGKVNGTLGGRRMVVPVVQKRLS